jgi:hypothetical protein
MHSIESADFMYPMRADIFYPDVEQGSYGNVKKTWIQDRNIQCFFGGGGRKLKEELVPAPNIKQDTMLIGRTKVDIRFTSRDSKAAATNIIVSNITDSFGNQVYLETSGPRSGKATIFEIASIEPFMGPFGKVEHFKIVLRRSENQAVDI